MGIPADPKHYLQPHLFLSIWKKTWGREMYFYLEHFQMFVLLQNSRNLSNFTSFREISSNLFGAYHSIVVSDRSSVSYDV